MSLNLVSKKQVFVFGDGVPQIHDSVRKLYKAALQSALVSKYLRIFSASLQALAGDIPRLERAPFLAKDLLELSETHLQDGLNNIAVTFLLTSGVQLGWLILQIESEPTLLHDGCHKIIVGLCMGLLPALAVAISDDSTTLLHVTPEIIRLSLVLGLHLISRGNSVEQTMESWACVVTGVPQDEAMAIISDFHESLMKAANLRIPGALAIHAPHIEMPDLGNILEDSLLRDMLIPRNVSIISPSSGALINISSLLKDALLESSAEIFSRPIQWMRIERSLEALIGQSGSKISQFGIGGVSRLLRAAHPSSPLRTIAEENLGTTPLASSENRDVAIVGMAGRWPGADTLEAFWRVLESGLDLHKRVPPDRFDVELHHDPSGKTPNSSLTPFGCFLDNAGHFDRRLFRMSPAEAKQTDPMQRLQLLTTYEALEMAGYAYDRTSATSHKRVGTFFGQSCDDWRQTNAAQEIDTFYIPGGARAFGPGRVSYHFGWEGPSYSIDTACSASVASIHLASNALYLHECDTAVVSAANVLTTPDNFAGLTRGGFVSPTGASKTFDENADGYCRADAVCTLILKRLDSALADNDNVHAVIKSTALNSSAQAISITHPHAATQADLFKQTLRRADLLPADVDHFELHGTGTKAGDMAEATAVLSVFGAAKSRLKQRPLTITAVKPNVGHSEAASGLSSIIKSVLMLRNSQIPPHIGIKTAINPSLPPLADSNIVIPKTLTDFEALQGGEGKRRIMVNNLNAGGGNACIILEDSAMSRASKSIDSRRTHVVSISAETQYPQDLIEQMRLDTKFDDPTELRSQRADIAFVFSGQGSWSSGLARELYVTSQVFKHSIEASAKICHSLGFGSLLEVLIGSSAGGVTNDTMGPQLALVAFELALAAMWKSLGLIPKAVIGHSLGEYAALCVAGALSITDTLYLVYHRAWLMQEKCSLNTHGMLSILASTAEVAPYLNTPHHSSELACINGPRTVVVGGSKGDLMRIEVELMSQGIKTSSLEVPYAFHTSQLDSMLPAYAHMTKSIQFNKLHVPFGSTLLGKFVTSIDYLPADYLVKQAREPVQLSKALIQGLKDKMIDERTTWFELGPSPVCLGFIKTILGNADSHLLPTCSSSSNHQERVARTLAQAYQNGLDVSWSEYHREYEHSLTLLDLPKYSFDLDNYWIQYHGDWSLLKGRKNTVAPVSRPSHPYLGATLQILVGERTEKSSKVFEFATDMKDNRFRRIAAGYSVCGLEICPSTVYVDMAWKAASYIINQRRGKGTQGRIEFTDMALGKPLVLESKLDHMKITVEARTDEHCSSIRVVVLGKAETGTVEYARCLIKRNTIGEMRTPSSSILSSIDRLQKVAESQTISRLSKSMVYRLYSTHVQYDKKYQGIKEIYIDQKQSEAFANVVLEPSSRSTDVISCSPVWLETVCHVSGFLANEIGDGEDDYTYRMLGWDSLSLDALLQSGQVYQSHVTLSQDSAAKLTVGNLYVMQQNSLIATVSGLKFQRIRKTAFKKTSSTASEIEDDGPPDTHIATPAEDSTTSPDQDSAPSLLSHSLPSPKPHSLSHLDASPEFPAELDLLRAIIAAQLEIEASELSEHANLADLGLNSITSLSILSTFESRSRKVLPSSFFYDHLTLADARAYLERT